MKKLQRLIVIVLAFMVAACAGLPPQTNQPQTFALQHTEATRLGTQFVPEEQKHPGDTAFHLLQDPTDAIVARIMLAGTADRSLDLQYYIWHDDLVGRELAAALLKAADRGVRVRVLLDDLGTNADDQVLLTLNSHPNLQIRLFNPVASRHFKSLATALEFSRVDRRMHNKAMIADNEAAILGGRNIGDEYFGASNVVAFGDLDVLVHGPVVREVSNAFDQFWNSESSYSIEQLTGHAADPSALAAYRAKLDEYIQSQHDSAYVVQARERMAAVLDPGSTDFSWGQATLLYDDPSKVTRDPNDAQGHLMTKFAALNLKPTHEMLIISPYFVPGKEGVAWISDLTTRGVRVTVLTNSLAATDVVAVNAGYEHYREDLLKAGVHLYELKPVSTVHVKSQRKIFGSSRASLHAKTYVFDRQSVFIGSMNLDPRSSHLNTEIGVLCNSPAIAGQVVDDVEPHLDQIAWRVELHTDANGSKRIVWIDTAEDGTVTELDSEPDVSFGRRTSIWFMGLLPIESQL
ncbi:phospholipase D family protein [Paraburkholderia sp. CNPSo 3274]|uniref:phospholipase D family protein n=1 Tax=Paraburkholderia sp. CNPSo 3274 TaxID=2940932 RepID=UPI0020B8ACDC|nr:phospholipase D family protein [Paraburkholderia sp. CNPSo 3274]MCP3705588.1 phospholipase D family protein [Paraburkholderia sp. CNPSo 3274]